MIFLKQQILTPGVSGGLRLWDATSGDIVETIAVTERRVSRAALSCDAQLVAVATSDASPTVSVYHLADGDELWRKGSSSPAIAFEPQGRWMATAVYERGKNTVVIRHADTGRELCRLNGHNALVSELAFSSDGLPYSLDVHGNMHAWNVSEQRQQWALSLLEWASRDN